MGDGSDEKFAVTIVLLEKKSGHLFSNCPATAQILMPAMQKIS
jgi:hypothetical protein